MLADKHLFSASGLLLHSNTEHLIWFVWSKNVSLGLVSRVASLVNMSIKHANSNQKYNRFSISVFNKGEIIWS